jgi:hypothetical protein
MISVPITKGKSTMPLAEFNAKKDDIINLARRPGSYAALTDFYQGNIDASGTIRYPACFPKDGDSCHYFKVIDLTVKSCKIKADSSITTTSVSDSFIYPEYFEISGIITN